MSIAAALTELLKTAEELTQAKAANEANTKAHVIEPLLASLHWNLKDFNEVDREYKVYDGTFLDLALRIDGKPKLFIEAKALGKSLNDKQFIAQTVNYANNEGVVWCVLTNGIVYRVYKSNEPVPMDQKLLFEVDLNDAASPEGRTQVVDSLSVLDREAVSAGKLDAWGEAIFVDVRVRAALVELGLHPTPGFVSAVSKAIDEPGIDSATLKTSLSRVLGGLGGEKAGPLVGTPPAPPKKPQDKKSAAPASAKKTSYTTEHHTDGKPAAIINLFEQVDGYALSLGDDVQRRPVKQYIGYFAGKRSFFTLELQKRKIYVYISLPPGEAKPWSDEEMRDVASIGHFGMGDTEFVLRQPEQLDRLKELLQKAYLRNRK